jgi:hypothetical protein
LLLGLLFICTLQRSLVTSQIFALSEVKVLVFGSLHDPPSYLLVVTQGGSRSDPRVWVVEIVNIGHYDPTSTTGVIIEALSESIRLDNIVYYYSLFYLFLFKPPSHYDPTSTRGS